MGKVSRGKPWGIPGSKGVIVTGRVKLSPFYVLRGLVKIIIHLITGNPSPDDLADLAQIIGSAIPRVAVIWSDETAAILVLIIGEHQIRNEKRVNVDECFITRKGLVEKAHAVKSSISDRDISDALTRVIEKRDLVAPYPDPHDTKSRYRLSNAVRKPPDGVE
jgi:hypothetical protein